MSDTRFSTETFLSLLQKKNGGIAIPIIQRAYTQGGRGTGKNEDQQVKRTGEAFLDCLSKALLGDDPVEIDFIYGTNEIRKSEEGKDVQIIQPLDGQQRLTTLFLLHWYLANKEGKVDEYKNTLNMFTYETRVSSRTFCEKLCLHTITVSCETVDDFRNAIENQSWFLLGWKKDPSVLSMLGMLGMIHGRLNGKTVGLWEKLIAEPPDAPIIFFYTPLEAFGLTDDLYIKMNARGKELTAFEKVKAAFNKKIDVEKWDAGKKLDESFGNQADNEWTDLLWCFRDASNQIDRYFLRLISALLVSYYAGKDRDVAIRLFNNPDGVLPDDLNKSAYDYLYESLNLVASASEKIADGEICDSIFWWRNIRDTEMRNFSSFMSLFISRKNADLSWQEHVLLYAFILYWNRVDMVDISCFKDWLRFVRNIITNIRLDEYDQFVGAKALFDELASGVSDIYTWLVEGTVKSGFAGVQMEEEKAKAQIFVKSPFSKSIIQNMEDCNFCRGRVKFVLECIDAYDCRSVVNLAKLQKACEVIFEYLNDNDVCNDFRRGMLTIGDGNYYTYWWSWLYAADAKKRCFIADIEDLRRFANDPNRSHYLKDLLNRLMNQTLCELVDEFQLPDDMPNWKKRIIKEPNLLDYSKKHFVGIPDDDSCCWLIPRNRVDDNDKGREKLRKII